MKNREISFEKQNISLMMLMTIPSIVNYIFQIVLARILPVEAFGTTNSLFSLIGILSIPASIIAMVALKSIGAASISSKQEVVKVLKVLVYCTLVLLGILLISGLLSADLLGKALGIAEREYIFVGCIAAGMAIIRQVWMSSMQGLLKLTEVGIQANVTAFSKLLISIVMLYTGFQIMGVLLSVVLAEIITILYCVWVMREYVKTIRGIRADVLKYIRTWKGAAGVILIGQSAMVILSNCDMILIKAYFPERIAGLFSSALIVARIGLYVSTMVVYTLFPVAVHQKEQGKNTKKIFRKAMFFCGGIFFLFVLGILFFGDSIIRILYGNQYAEAAALFPVIFIYMIPLALLTVVMNYVIAVDEGKFFSISMLICIVLLFVTTYLCRMDLNLMFIVAGILLSSFTVINIIHVEKEPVVKLRKKNEPF